MVCTCTSKGSTELEEKLQFGPLYEEVRAGVRDLTAP
jgi:hypothetical protein